MHQFANSQKPWNWQMIPTHSQQIRILPTPPNPMFLLGFAPSKGNRCHRCVDHARFQLHCPRHVPWSPPWHPGRWRSPRLPPSPRHGPNWKTLGISWHPQCPRMPTKPYVEPWQQTNVWNCLSRVFQPNAAESNEQRQKLQFSYHFHTVKVSVFFVSCRATLKMKSSTASGTSCDFVSGVPSWTRTRYCRFQSNRKAACVKHR